MVIDGWAIGKILLRRFRDGFVLPDIRFEPDGRYIDITAEPFEYQNPPVTFLRRSKERVRIDEFERDMAAFIELVVQKLSDNKVRNTWLDERWSCIQKSLENDEERLFCEAAGALGIDPYTCDEAAAHSIETSADFFEGDALQEFLASQRPEQATEALEWLTTAEKQVGDKAALPGIAAVKKSIQQYEAASVLPVRPWELGYAVAAGCRKELGLKPERVFDDEAEIAALFGGLHFEAAVGRVPGLRAEVYDSGDQVPKIIVAGLPASQSRNFAMMRAIGDFLSFEQDGRAPITDTYSYRQAVGRAFAIEMLAPTETILQMERDGMSVDEIAEARNVSEDAVAHHLGNRRVRRP